MKISLSWVEELLGERTGLDPERLRETLLDLGFETAGISAYPGCSGIVAAEVLEVAKHPNADRLRIAKVTDGQNATEVVCGAPNLEVGQKVLWAQVGAKLSDGTVLKETPIRGVKSPGMLCSARELGVGEDHSGLWILPANTAVGSVRMPATARLIAR
jgi:phenylalanyl-tRNA synthetase beta chain